MRTSYSALNTFQTCSLKYKFQNIDKIKTPKSKEAVFGTIIHSVLKFLHNPQPIPPTIEDVLEYYNNLWNSEIYEDKQEEIAVLANGVRILQNYYAKNNPKNFDVIDLETRFNLDIEDITLTGIIDRIDKLADGSFEIIDYKTGKKLPAQQDIDNDFQLSIYSMAVKDRWPKLDQPIKLSLYYLKHNIKLSSFRTPEQIRQTKEIILDITEEIKKGNFVPTPNALCGWCGYQKECPMFQHKFKKEKYNSKDIDIKAILKEYYELKSEDKKNRQRVAELQKMINEYCDAEKIERVFGDGIYVTRIAQQRFDYDILKVKNVLEPLGKWDKVISINSVKLKDVLSKLSYEDQKEIEKAKKLKKEFKSLSLKEEKKV